MSEPVSIKEILQHPVVMPSESAASAVESVVTPRCQEPECNGGWIVEESSEGNSGGRQARPCRCLIEEARLRAVGERFVSATFQGIEQDARSVGRTPHPTLLAARDRMVKRPAGSYFITGEYGSWKTYLAAAQFNELFNQAVERSVFGFSAIRFLRDIDLYRSLRDDELGQGHPSITSGDIKTGRIRHLFIDDLGKKSVSPFVRQAYFDLIDEIFLNRKGCGLTITSNYALEGLAYDNAGNEVHDPGIIRRIHDLCEILEVRRS